MEPYQIENVVTTLIIASTFVSGLWIVSRAFIARRTLVGAADLARLVESVERLRESVDGLRIDVGDVTERLEFTERVLAQIADVQRPERQQLH